LLGATVQPNAESVPPTGASFPPIGRKYVWPHLAQVCFSPHHLAQVCFSLIWRKFVLAVLAQVFPTQSFNPNVNILGSLVSF